MSLCCKNKMRNTLLKDPTILGNYRKPCETFGKIFIPP